jgi:hypothetical protein
MTSFIHTEYPLQHDGVVRAEQALATLRQAIRGFNTTRATASLLLAAVVAALVVLANQLIEVWTDGHLMVGWVALWTVTFAAIALLAKPLRQTVYGLREARTAWSARRDQAIADDRLWGIALADARVMADISRAMTADARMPARSQR